MTTGNCILGHFDALPDARTCLRGLARGRAERPQLTVSVRKPGDSHEEIPIALTGARGGLVQGAILGTLSGVLGALLLGGVPGEDRFTMLLPLFAGVACAPLGALAGMLVGAGGPSPELEAMESAHGITVIVSSPDAADRTWAEALLRSSGAKLAEDGPLIDGSP